MMVSVRRPGSGFTLLEVVLATAMFAVLLGAVYGLFHSAHALRAPKCVWRHDQ